MPPGDWRVRSVHSKEAQAVRIQLRNLILVAMPTPLAYVEGSIRTTAMRGCLGVAGVQDQGMLSKGFPANTGELPLSRAKMGVECRPTQSAPGPMGHEGRPAGSEQPSTRETCRQGRPEATATDRGEVLRAHSSDEGGEPQGSHKGRPRHPLERRGEQVNGSMPGYMHGT